MYFISPVVLYNEEHFCLISKTLLFQLHLKECDFHCSINCLTCFVIAVAIVVCQYFECKAYITKINVKLIYLITFLASCILFVNIKWLDSMNFFNDITNIVYDFKSVWGKLPHYPLIFQFKIDVWFQYFHVTAVAFVCCLWNVRHTSMYYFKKILLHLMARIMRARRALTLYPLRTRRMLMP